MENQQELLLMSMFVLGLRHGLDWDHLAALADIAGTQDEARSGFFLCLLYAAGHAFVVLALGYFAVQMGTMLPASVDSFMEPVVGLTLIALSFWLTISMLRQGTAFRLTSRWSMLSQLFTRRSGQPLVEKIAVAKTPVAATLLTGAIHGVGAETPTQILALLAAATVAHGILSVLLVVSFVAGIFVSNMVVATLMLKGYASIRNRTWLNLSLGTLTAVFSLVIGITFLTRSASALPPLSGALAPSVVTLAVVRGDTQNAGIA